MSTKLIIKEFRLEKTSMIIKTHTSKGVQLEMLFYENLCCFSRIVMDYYFMSDHLTSTTIINASVYRDTGLSFDQLAAASILL